ncbi:Nif11-like leader peptide family natural product precursor [Phormidium sp. FACHB-592]|uniref:Nif11-like leader peptide family natural product n=1 Tax=Stenomitos frigidus AS-A4 TaxID=2933935 RepID=A0ABV0KP82_9CYAN|nr:Nif11-like leader peptide family natural product precursor [Phormidium sp. FACHB-592]MBD2072883.1 Nif11-like leader peptide family natural product precursor [Phormidium sp. FACHB-592]
MAKEVVTQLFRAAQADPALREQLNQAPNIEQFVVLARNYGYEFTLEEWQSMTGFAVEELEGELSDLPGAGM